MLALGLAIPASADTFDLITFAPPPGTRTEGSQNISFTDNTPTTYVVYGIFKSVPGSGNPTQDFQADWQDLVARNHRVTGELKTETVDWPGGWKMTMGAAKAWTEQQRNFVDLMSVFTGYGVKVTVLITYNDDMYRPQIDKFLASIHLQPPAVVTTPPPASATTQTGANPSSLTAHEWYHSEASYSHWGTNLSGAEIAKIGSQGATKWSYRFMPDGTYTFVNEFWSLQKHKEYWVIEERGNYRQTDKTLNIMPAQSLLILRDPNGQQIGEAKPRKLETVSYRYAFQYLSGMQRWYLILMPETGNDTVRDGTRHKLPDYGPAYRYGPRPYCEQRPRPADCKG
ncbi:MAG: hypothetical protein GC149_15070 [Gammaproteobacteria bacterium]|nr:hypothetical protein [Gammaproteobacteria bacterium]